MGRFLENLLERAMFASRWVLSPIYIVLSLTLFLIMILVKEIKDQQEKNDLINIKKKPPKWLLGRETLYEPKKC